MDEKALREEIRGAFQLRAAVYYYLYDEMEKALGKEMAQQIFRKATFRTGRDIQKKYQDCLEACDFSEISRRFRALSAMGGELFTPAVEKADEHEAIVTMATCPLADTWRHMGLDDEKIRDLCDAASAIDFGTFESETTSLAFSDTIGSGGPQCRLVISRKKE